MRRAPPTLTPLMASNRVRPVRMACVEASVASSALARAVLTRPSTSVIRSTAMPRLRARRSC